MLSDCLPPQALSLGTSEHKILLEEGHRAGLELKQSRSPFLCTVVTLSALSRQMMHTPFIHDSTHVGFCNFPLLFSWLRIMGIWDALKGRGEIFWVGSMVGTTHTSSSGISHQACGTQTQERKEGRFKQLRWRPDLSSQLWVPPYLQIILWYFDFN